MDEAIKNNKYGKVYSDVKNIMKQKNITRTELVKRSGLTYRTVDKYINDTIEIIDFKVLIRLCNALECGVKEILKYDPKRN